MKMERFLICYLIKIECYVVEANQNLKKTAKKLHQRNK